MDREKERANSRRHEEEGKIENADRERRRDGTIADAMGATRTEI